MGSSSPGSYICTGSPSKFTGADLEGQAQLDNFIDPESRYPVLVTTSRLLSTGVCLAHASSVFLVHAENNRFLETVSAFLQERRDLPGHELGPLIQDQRAVEVLDVVDAVLDLLAIAVELPLFGTIALHVAIDMDLDDLVGRQKTVADTFLQGIGVHRARRNNGCWKRSGFPWAWR